MKKEMLITIVLVLGLSFDSFAGTGNARGAIYFFLVFAVLLLIVLGLIYGIDYLKKNGKTIINNAMSDLHKKITLLKNYLNKVKSDYLDLSYF